MLSSSAESVYIMKNHITSAAAIVSSLFVLSCGDSGPSRPTTTTSTSATTAPPVSQFEIVTLLTVNLRRFFNDADNDGWSVDGRHGEGRDWPHDGRGNGNDPDGWTAQMIVTVTRL